MSAIVFEGGQEIVQKGCWKIDQNEEACYIDIEEEKGDDAKEMRNFSEWCHLPDILLEEVFSHLSLKERYYASLVCRNWYRAFHMPAIWKNFLVDDQTLTRTKYNYYSGWQHWLDHMRTQNCMARVGRYLRGLVFRPEHSFNNIFQFMAMLSWSIVKVVAKRIHILKERHERLERTIYELRFGLLINPTSLQGHGENAPPELRGCGSKIRSLVYIFPCSMSQRDDPEGIQLFGTGGQLLKGLKELMSKLPQLRVLKLVDFVLERYEANHLLDEVLDTCCTQMRMINIVNVTTTHCPIIHVGLFLNLQILIISPQNIDDTVLHLLADTKLKHLHLLQNRYTPSSVEIQPCGVKAWRALKRCNPNLKVHLRVEAIVDGDVVFQPEAPVASVLYNAPKAKINPETLLRMVDNYKSTLSTYGHELLPKFSSPKSFHNRIDNLMVLLCRQCHNISTLIIREKISTSTVLLIAKTARNLHQFHIRRFAVILRCDWPKNPDWSDEFYLWLRNSSKSYQACETEVSQILGRRWRFMTDHDFKAIDINVRREYL